MNIGQWYSYTGTPSGSTTTQQAGVDVMVVSQNQINNTSLVRIRPWIKRTTTGTGAYNLSSKTMTIKANNVSRTTTIRYDLREADYNDKVYLTSSFPFKRMSGSGSLVSGAYVYDYTITHNDDGTKNNVPIYAFIPLDNSGTAKNWTVDVDIDLPEIPRANTLTYSYTYIDEPIKFSIGKASSNFTSTLSFYTYNENGSFSNTYTIAEKTNETSINYTIPTDILNTILSANKTKNKISFFINLYTYSGNDELDVNSYITSIPLKQTNPIVSATYEDTNPTTVAMTGNSSKIIKYVSKPKVVITATPQQQADIISYSTIWGNSSSTTQETTFTNGIDSSILQVSAKDSRNWVGSASYDISSNYIEYIKLGIEKFTLVRPETTSNTINANVNGVWFNDNFGVSTNTLELKFRYKEKGGEYGEYQTISLTTEGNTFKFNGSIGDSYNYQKQYDFEFVLSDKVMSLTATFNVTSGESIIRIAETYVRILGDLKVRGNTTINGNLTLNDELLNKQIGDIVITSTNENPSSRLGGTWELFDKEFSYKGGTFDNCFTSNTSNVKSYDFKFVRSGHNIFIRLNVVNKVALTDTTIDLGKFNWEVLGFRSLYYGMFELVGASDGGQALVMARIQASGEMTTTDVHNINGSHNIGAGSVTYWNFSYPIHYEVMLDEACDKFYWKKTA